VDIDFVNEQEEGLVSLDRMHADHAAARAMVFELDPAVDLREERVVFATADVQPRAEPSSALTDEDRAARHDVAIEPFHAEAL
jgi:hypothetical protein